MEEEELKYNTQRKKLILPEYGRNIHIMVNYLLTIKDREERTKAAKTVIDVMGNLYPHLRDVPISVINCGTIWPSCRISN